MTEDELRIQVEERLRGDYQPHFDRQRKEQDALDQLSDEDWWTQYSTSRSRLGGTLDGLLDGMKNHLIERRYERSRWLAEGGPEELIRTKASAILPALIEVRSEANEDGPLTDDQYMKASVRLSQAQIQSMSERIAERASAEEDPRKRAFLEQFCRNVQADMEDMQVMRDPTTVTEEQLSHVTARIVSRMYELSATKRQPE